MGCHGEQIEVQIDIDRSGFKHYQVIVVNLQISVKVDSAVDFMDRNAHLAVFCEGMCKHDLSVFMTKIVKKYNIVRNLYKCLRILHFKLHVAFLKFASLF